MPQLVSPGVLSREIDLTTIIPAVATTDAVIAGVMRWGEIGTRILIDSEDQLVKRFGKPTNLNAETWFTAASFLAYGNRLWVSRAANTQGVSPDFEANVTANSTTVVLTGNNEVTNVTSLGLAPGQLLLASEQNSVYISVDARINDIINSSAFSLSTASDVKVVEGANTVNDVAIAVDTDVNATTLMILSSGNTDDLAVGFILTDSSNTGVINTDTAAEITSIVNSTAFVTNVDIVIANGSATVDFIKKGTLQLQFVSNTVFSAVANTGRVANLEYCIIKNEEHFESKGNTFDTDVKFIARHPGELGNSLKVSVCGNSEGYEETINLATYASRTTWQINVNSNSAVLSVAGGNSSVAAANMAALKASFQVTDMVEVGNTLLGTQYMKITAISNTSTYGTTTNATPTVTTIAGNTFVVADDTSDLAAGMICTVAANSYLRDLVVNNVVNSTAFYTTTAPVVNTTANTSTWSPRSTVTFQFEDPFQLGDHYKFESSNSATRTVHRVWEFYSLLDKAPGQSDYVIEFGNSAINNDEMHIVVTDEGGKFTGIPGTVLEVYRAVSRATDGKDADGGGNYWRDRVNDASQYIYAVNDLSGAASGTAENLANSTLDVQSLRFVHGKDGQDEANIPISLLTNAYDLYQSPEDIDIALVLQGRTRSFQLANYLIDNIAHKRQDCVVFISPQKSDVINNVGNEAAAIVNFRNNVRSTSYGVMDSGYKKMYDRYNDITRWIPLNGDIAGLCVRTDETNDPWWSPAGYNRGHIKNVITLPYNPRQADRDTLYKAGVNPVISPRGEGTILLGDKTLLAKPSAFDRINVRRLFIVLRKAISEASKYTLFEFNDEFTRSQFKNLVNPYLRNIKGRRGIYDFLVVCDDTNNTPEIIDRNEFIGDIYIKPARSINFIYLNFVAVRTGVAFSEVVGKF